MISWFNSKSRSEKTSVQKPSSTSDNSSDLSEHAQKLLNEYYQIRVKLDKVSLAKNKNEFLEIVKDKSFKRNVRQRFEKLAGLVGGSYAVINKSNRKAKIYRSSKISDQKNTDDVMPCVGVRIAKSFVKDKSKFEGEIRDKCVLKAMLIDLMYEADNAVFELTPKEDHKSPWFLQNLPPYQSNYAFSPLPFERKLREEKNSNYLYCYTGEVVFHIYAWRWLIKYAQHNGFDSTVNLEMPHIPNTDSAEQIWEITHWEDRELSELPEFRWLIRINSHKKDLELGRADAQKFGKLKTYWTSTIQKYDRINNGDKYDFLKEWDYLGLTEKHSTIAHSVRIALFRYARHLLRQLPKQDSIEENKSIPIISENKDFLKIIEIQQNVNSLVDRILAQEPEQRKPLLDQLEEEGEFIYLHFLYRKIIYHALASTIGTKDRSIKNLLIELHKKARFPILPSYFQTLLSEDRLPIEHYCFPLAQSFSSPFDVNLPDISKSGSQPIKNANIAVACMNLRPVWAINDRYGLTENQDYCSDKENAVVSHESAARLRIIQDYIKCLSIHLVDYVFYEAEKERAQDKVSTAQYYMQAHEVKKIIGEIRGQTPPFKLDKIRQYFNVIYGSNEDLISLYYSNSKKEEFHEKCDIGTNFKQLVDNAFHIASEVQIMATWNERDLEKELFNQRVDELRDLAKIDFLLQSKNTAYLMRSDEEAELSEKYGFYVLFSTICAIRNCLKHNRSGSNIEIGFDRSERYLVIKNLPPISPITKKSPKMNPGSTGEALKYLVDKYDKNFKNIGPEKEGEYWVTRVPIYKA